MKILIENPKEFKPIKIIIEGPEEAKALLIELNSIPNHPSSFGTESCDICRIKKVLKDAIA